MINMAGGIFTSSMELVSDNFALSINMLVGNNLALVLLKTTNEERRRLIGYGKVRPI